MLNVSARPRTAAASAQAGIKTIKPFPLSDKCSPTEEEEEEELACYLNGLKSSGFYSTCVDAAATSFSS